MGPAVHLLAEESDDIVDLEILEKYPLLRASPDSILFLSIPPGLGPTFRKDFAVTFDGTVESGLGMAASGPGLGILEG